MLLMLLLLQAVLLLLQRCRAPSPSESPLHAPARAACKQFNESKLM